MCVWPVLNPDPGKRFTKPFSTIHSNRKQAFLTLTFVTMFPFVKFRRAQCHHQDNNRWILLFRMNQSLHRPCIRPQRHSKGKPPSWKRRELSHTHIALGEFKLFPQPFDGKSKGERLLLEEFSSERNLSIQSAQVAGNLLECVVLTRRNQRRCTWRHQQDNGSIRFSLWEEKGAQTVQVLYSRRTLRWTVQYRAKRRGGGVFTHMYSVHFSVPDSIRYTYRKEVRRRRGYFFSNLMVSFSGPSAWGLILPKFDRPD